MLIQVLGAALAVIAFAIIYSVPKKYLLYCGIAGGGGWVVYLLFVEFLDTVFLSAFVSALVVSLLSHVFARVEKAPVTLFLIAGILPLVPGIGMYRIIYYLITGDTVQTSYYLRYTLEFAGAIAIAIFIMDTVFKLIPRKYANKRRMFRKNRNSIKTKG
jgi:uncharacterized membrane protein YjjB (DUF3815 family)